MKKVLSCHSETLQEKAGLDFVPRLFSENLKYEQLHTAM